MKEKKAKSKASASFVNLFHPLATACGRRVHPERLPAEMGWDDPGGSLLPPRGPGCSCGESRLMGGWGGSGLKAAAGLGEG